MSNQSLADRVAALEKEVADLKAASSNGAPKKDWRSAVGIFAGDEVMKEIFAEAMKFREADREKARRRFAKPRRSKK
jgi:hypothetical protein